MESAHTIGQDITLPATKIISEELFSDKQAEEIGEIPMSNTTVKRSISFKDERNICFRAG